MDWKLFLSTFLTIFIAEMGDKTQFAALAASSQSHGIREVLLGVCLALLLAGCIGVFAGRILIQFISPGFLRYLASALFIAMGVWILFRGNT